METRTIVVVPYRPEWPGLFRRRAERIAGFKTPSRMSDVNGLAVKCSFHNRGVSCATSRVIAYRTGAMQLKAVLRQINPDDDNLFQGRLLLTLRR